jgi:hypothetical protein
MKVLYVKVSERKKANSIITKIIEENGKRYVIKSAMYEEGARHIENIVDNADTLRYLYSRQYSLSKIIDYDRKRKEVKLEYLDAEPLSYQYRDCIKRQNVATLIELIDEHKQLLRVSEDNICLFHETDLSRKVFGDMSFFEGAPALKITNWEATPKNIYKISNTYVFTDYEWVFDFPIPIDVVYYHIFINACYTTFLGMNDFFPKEKMMGHLRICEESENAWNNFYINYYSTFGEWVDYSRYKKNSITLEALLHLPEENRAQNKYIENLKQGWETDNKKLNEEITKGQELSLQVDSLQKECTEMKIINENLFKTNSEYKNYIDILEKRLRYLS